MRTVTLAASLLLALVSLAAAETVGFITDVRPGGGQIEVKRRDAGTWLPAVPLLSLEPGDQVRTTADATAVVVLSGGRGSVQVDAARSPFILTTAPAGPARLERMWALIRQSLPFLAGADATPHVPLSSRGPADPVALLVVGPRGLVLPGATRLEWRAPGSVRCVVRVMGRGGVLFERPGIMDGRLVYPPDAPPLREGERYTVQVETPDAQSQADFTVVDAARAADVRARISGALALAAGDDSPASRAILSAAVLAHESLLHDARLVVQDALAQSPDDPTLQRILDGLTERLIEGRRP